MMPFMCSSTPAMTPAPGKEPGLRKFVPQRRTEVSLHYPVLRQSTGVLGPAFDCPASRVNQPGIAQGNAMNPPAAALREPEILPQSRAEHDRMANAIRALAMDAVEQAKSGHPGLPMGAADVATVLFTKFLKYDAADPRWPDRDRFVLSAGHGSMLLYGLLHLTGVEGVTLDELRRFRQLESKTPGHPECFMTPGVETTTGPLGQGLGAAVGMALAERMLAAEFGPEIVDHYTYVLASDGDLMEGLSQEAIAPPRPPRPTRLTVVF